MPSLAFASALAVVSSLAAPPSAPPSPASADRRLVVLRAMQDELARSRDKLELPGEDKPYFIRFLARDYDEREITARFGAVIEDSKQAARHATVEVRVGDYQFDNTADSGSEGMFDMDDFQRWEPSIVAPIDNDGQALRAALWLLADGRYKNALSQLHKKRGKRVTTLVEDDTLPSFSKERSGKAPLAQPVVDPPLPVTFAHDQWTARLRAASQRFRNYPGFLDGTIKVSLSHQVRTIVTTEGAALINERLIYGLHLQAIARADDGLLVEHGKSVYGGREGEMPDDARLLALVDELAREVEALRHAPALDPYNGPAILLPEAAGVFFHEALGHRLEGERQNATDEGATFKGALGKPILPTFIDVLDDPTLRAVGPISLNGHYAFDDEAVGARPVTLVERGVLRAYLKSRTPVKGLIDSNGHGRAEGVSDPIGRMASTIVRSTKQVPMARLKQMLLAEIARQKKDFGLIIADISGGQTNTTTYDFQAFKGVPRVVYKVAAKTGKETLIKGVEFVGTPIGSLNRILATSDRQGVFNGFCGAESGFIPVSTVAPALLISEIELQRTRRAMERPTILPPPWTK